MTLVEGDEVDGLDLGRPPRPPLSRRAKGLLGGGLVAVVAVAVAVLLMSRPAGRSAAPATPTPLAQSSAGFAAGPVLVSVDGRDALQAPELPGRGFSVHPVVLAPAPEIVALVARSLPGLRDVRGGRVPDDDRYGVYLAGSYGTDLANPTTVTLYTVRAPGTTFGSDQYVSRTRFDRQYTVRTDVSVFTGSGWWVHIVSLAPDAPGTETTGEVSRLLPLARNPALVAP